jgi:hypothetical protein
VCSCLGSEAELGDLKSELLRSTSVARALRARGSRSRPGLLVMPLLVLRQRRLTLHQANCKRPLSRRLKPSVPLSHGFAVPVPLIGFPLRSAPAESQSFARSRGCGCARSTHRTA